VGLQAATKFEDRTWDGAYDNEIQKNKKLLNFLIKIDLSNFHEAFIYLIATNYFTKQITCNSADSPLAAWNLNLMPW
jgi:hypothetical protein